MAELVVVKYTGPHTAVDVRVNGDWVTVDRGGTVEVDKATAASMATQVGHWERVAEKKPAAKDKE